MQLFKRNEESLYSLIWYDLQDILLSEKKKKPTKIGNSDHVLSTEGR